MGNAWIVARRELGAIFVQPIAYVVAIMILLPTGYLFALQIGFSAQQPGGIPPSLADILGTFNFLALFFMPLITMRLLAEEQKSGTMELLMTLPVRDGEVVLGKYLAAMIFYLVIAAPTLIYALVLLNFGNPDVGPMLTAYLSVVLWGSALVGIGTLASTLSENQIVAAIIAFGITLILYLIAIPAQFVVDNPTISTALNELSFPAHQENLLIGLVTAKDVLYYLLVTAVFLFAAARVLESRRWR